MGGMVGLEWMKNWPKDFQAAVLVNTSVRGLSPLYYRLQPRNYPRILRILLSNNPEFVERTILEMTSHNQSRFKELTEDWARIQKERPVSAINALKQIIAASRFLPSGEKPSVPILLLNGAGDHLVNPACSRALAENWNLPLRVHPTAGHDLTLDEPEWVLEQVRDWQK
jgi:pimeloyl-ACP methyl ester carboxylesterase